MSADTTPVPRGRPLADEESLQETVTRVVTALRKRSVPFALAGGSAVYAHGGPPTTHDVDVFLCESDVDEAVRALVDAGMKAYDPPEDWLTKVYWDDWLVDLIFRPNDTPVTPETLATARDLRVGPIAAPVMPATAVIAEKLLVLGPHRCDFTEILPAVRALREQLDWDELRARTKESPYAQSFLLLTDLLGVSGEGELR